MEYSKGELQCLNLESTGLDHFASLADSYFNEEEAFDTTSDSSSDEDDNVDYRENEDVELIEVHLTERAKLQKFYPETCECNPDEKACSLTLTLDDFADSRKELSSTELDLVILGYRAC